MNISNEVLISIIGAMAAVIGAVFSTISIVLSNKNKKSINMLENSKDVKADIANKRYTAYNKIINYINSWYDVDEYHNHDYLKCHAARYLSMTVCKNRLINKDKILEELNVVQSLSLEYFYLDANTYVYLKALENYLSSVVNYASLEKIKNFTLFSYIVYYDMWNYILQLSKFVNKFIKQTDVLKYKPSNKFNYKIISRMLRNSNFYNIYFKFLYMQRNVKQIEEEINPKLELVNNEISKIQIDITNSLNKKEKKQLAKKLKLLKKIKKMLTIKPPKKIMKYKITETLKMWKICNECKNKDCYLSCAKTVKK